MEARRFGRTDHMSKVAIFGACALGQVAQSEADAVMEQIIAAGVNHIDVAPSYGDAEERLGPWMARERDRFFLGCKTMERTKEGAKAELHHSLERLQVESFDLYQIHAITNLVELDSVMRSGGALEALIEARQAGLTRFIGITGHGVEVPAVFLEALRRFDFDSILFPINFIQYANPTYRRIADDLLRQCRAKDVGTMIIKTIADKPWGEEPKTYHTWYKPFIEPDQIQKAVNFVLSQDVTGLCTPCDIRLISHVLQACDNFTRLLTAEQEALIASASEYEPLFT